MGGRSRWRRVGSGVVLWPLAIGLACCALGLWAGLVYSHNQAVFQAHAIPAKAVIDQIYTSGYTVGNAGAASFDQYAIVGFETAGRTAHARVMLAICAGKCISSYRVGQELNVFYNPENLGYAQLRPDGSPAGYFWPIGLGILGIALLVAAVINMMTPARRVTRGSRPSAAAQH